MRVRVIVSIVILVAGWFIGPKIDSLIGLSYTIQTHGWAPIIHDIAFGMYAIAIWESIKWSLKKK